MRLCDLFGTSDIRGWSGTPGPVPIVVRGAGDLIGRGVHQRLQTELRERCDALFFSEVDGVEHVSTISGAHAWELAERGCTLTVRGVTHVNAEVRRIAGTLFEGLTDHTNIGSRLFVSTASSAFAMHLDPVMTVTLQLEGSKRWLLGPRAVEADLSGVVRSVLLPPSVDDISIPGGLIPYPDFSHFRAVVLHPGDALYLPPGAWHCVSTPRRSVSLSLDWLQPQVLRREFRIEVVDHGSIHRSGSRAATRDGDAARSVASPTPASPVKSEGVSELGPRT